MFINELGQYNEFVPRIYINIDKKLALQRAPYSVRKLTLFIFKL